MWNIVGDRPSQSQCQCADGSKQWATARAATELLRREGKERSLDTGFTDWFTERQREREKSEGPKRPTNKHRGMRNWANICSSVTNIGSYEVSELNSYLVCKCTEAWQFCFFAFCYFLKTCLVISLTCTLASCWWDGMNWVGWVEEDTIDRFDHCFTLKNVHSTLIRLQEIQEFK